MKRKVIKQGHNTLTITLPSKWVEKCNIKPGDELELDDLDGTLKITNKPTLQIHRVELDISNLDFASIRHNMRSAYKLGYDEISLRFENAITKEFKTGKDEAVMTVIDQEVNTLLGCEIIQQTRNSCLIKDYSYANLEEMDNILRKIFLMIVDYSDELMAEAKSMNKILLQSMREKHFNISKFIFYYLRNLNKIGYKESSKTPIMYYIISSVDDILDIEKYACTYLIEFKQKSLRKETLDIIGDIVNEFRLFQDYFFKFRKEALLSFAERRWKIIYAIRQLGEKNYPRNELILLANLEHILELLIHLFEARMSLEYP